MGQGPSGPIDTDGDGHISKEEFETWLKEHHDWFCKEVQPLWGKSHLTNLHHKPAGYTEGSSVIRYIKAMAFAAVSFSIYYAALDSLSDVDKQQFEPCNEIDCHYWQLFGNDKIPGSGCDFMQVQNGVDRPLGLMDVSFQVYTDKFHSHIKPHSEKMEEFLHEHKSMNETVVKEQVKVNKLSWRSHGALLITKMPMRVMAFPFTKVAKLHEGSDWGMPNIVPALCPGHNKTSMQALCSHRDSKDQILNHMTVGMSRYFVFFFLFMWSVLRGMHDVLLLKGVSEKKTLMVMGTSCIFGGLSVATLFFWAMGAMGVYIAPLKDGECACYYHLPMLQSQVAFATPFALLFGFAARVQAFGMACLYGDYVTFMTFIMPHYLASSSMLWSWNTLVTPVVSGTHIVDKKRESFEPGDWKQLLRLHKFLYYIRIFATAFVALAACPFIVRYKEVIQEIVKEDWILHSAWRLALCKVVLVLPSIVILLLGVEMIYGLYHICFDKSPTVTFANHLTTYVPDLLFDKTTEKRLKDNKKLEHRLAVLAFVCLGGLTVVYVLAIALGLSPDADFLLGFKDAKGDAIEPIEPTLAQAELWGSCGFMFVTIALQRILNIVFAVYDDIALMKILAEPDKRPSVQDAELEAASGSPREPDAARALLSTAADG